MMGESTLLQLLVTAPLNPSVGSAASTTSTNEDNICRFRCHSRAQRGRPRAHGQNTGPPLSWATRQLRRHTGSPRPEGQSWSRVAGSLQSLAQQPWAPLKAPPRPLTLPCTVAREASLHSLMPAQPLWSLSLAEALWGDAGPRLQPLVTCHQTALLLACTETLLGNAVPTATDGFRASSGWILRRLRVARERRTFL